jgi:hypothetical protein
VRSDAIRGWIRRGQERDDELIDPIDGLLKTWSGILFKRTAQADDIANLDPWKRIAAYEDSGDENATKNATAHLQHRVRALLDEANPLPKRVANLANPPGHDHQLSANWVRRELGDALEIAVERAPERVEPKDALSGSRAAKIGSATWTPEQVDCLFLAPLGVEGTPARERADLLLNDVVLPAAMEFGLAALRDIQADSSAPVRVAEPGSADEGSNARVNTAACSQAGRACR